MQREQVREELKAIFENETGQTLSTLEDRLVLVEEFELDSVDLVSLLMQVESRFRVRLTHGEVSEVKTVGTLIDLVQEKIASSPPVVRTRRAA